MVDFVKVVDCRKFDPSELYDSFRCRATMTITELNVVTNMTKARFMRHLDSTLDRGIRIFEEGSTFYVPPRAARDDRAGADQCLPRAEGLVVAAEEGS